MVLLTIWFSGAMIASIFYFYQDRVQCVDRDGWFKGLFWCDASTGELGLFIKSLTWPFLIFSMASDNNRSNNEQGNVIEEIKSIPQNPRLLFVTSMSATIPVQAHIADCVGFEQTPESSNRLSSIKWFAELNDNTTFEQCINIAVVAWKAISDAYPATGIESPDGPALKYGEGPLFFPKNTYAHTKGFLNYGEIECSYDLTYETMDSMNIVLVFEKEETLSGQDIELLSNANLFTQAVGDQSIKLCN